MYTKEEITLALDDKRNDYIKFVEEITNTKYYIKDWVDNC